jgi:DNA-binding GntR family transcriptional regulator
LPPISTPFGRDDDEVKRLPRLAGTQLLQKEIASRIDVNSTQVREAFGVLEAEGFVERRFHRGVFVARRNLEDIEDVYEMRAALEAMTERRAALRQSARDVHQANAHSRLPRRPCVLQICISFETRTSSSIGHSSGRQGHRC